MNVINTPPNNGASLRLLVACEHCNRQYDASARHSGDRFLCTCGEAIKVPAMRVYDATVIRCSSCGGPRSGAQQACAYCQSDFTLHEHDLHTVCPKCMARISDRAKFCHHCATPILPQGTAGDATDHACPACGEGTTLVSRTLGHDRVSVLECGQCGGLWLNSGVFALLEERMQSVASAGETFNFRQHKGKGVQTNDKHGRFYRACPECDGLMYRRNYGRRSGVLVDTCKQHGVWFDIGELDTILRWIRTGGLAKARHWERQRVESEKQTKRFLDNIDKQRDQWSSRHEAADRGGVDVVGSILDYFFDE